MSADESSGYRGIARQVADRIRSGALQPGDRLPSLRQVSRRNGVSMATAIQAYRWLEEHDLIFARPGAGFFITAGDRGPTAKGAADPAPVGSVAEPWLPPRPATDLLPERRLSRLIGTMVRRYPSVLSTDTEPTGDYGLRRQIARRAADLGVDCHPGEIVITSGGLEAMTLALRAVAAPGDTVAVESPCSAPTLGVLRSLGLVAAEIEASAEHGIRLDRLDRVLATRDVRACLFATNCADPLGYVMSRSGKRALMHLLARYGIPLVENDILGDLGYGTRPCPAAALDPSGNTLLCSSFTYTLGPGLRLGWLLPGRYLERVLELKAASSVAPPPLMQRAVADYLRGSGFERHVRSLRRSLETRADHLARAVQAVFPSATRLHPPAGGSSLWIELPSGTDACALRESAACTGLDWIPGCRFTASRRLCTFMRLPAAEAWGRSMEARVLALAAQVARMTS